MKSVSQSAGKTVSNGCKLQRLDRTSLPVRLGDMRVQERRATIRVVDDIVRHSEETRRSGIKNPVQLMFPLSERCSLTWSIRPPDSESYLDNPVNCWKAKLSKLNKPISNEAPRITLENAQRLMHTTRLEIPRVMKQHECRATMKMVEDIVRHSEETRRVGIKNPTITDAPKTSFRYSQWTVL
jgi:hypothetical protein